MIDFKAIKIASALIKINSTGIKNFYENNPRLVNGSVDDIKEKSLVYVTKSAMVVIMTQLKLNALYADRINSCSDAPTFRNLANEIMKIGEAFSSCE